jgi:hypothetical protein
MSFVKWTKVSDSAPGDNTGKRDDVLFSDGKQIYFGKFKDGDFFELVDARDDEWSSPVGVTHWFIPELPE